MGANNLRVIYNNVADNATITATTSATNYPISNVLSDNKGSVWRSTSTISNTITLSWTTTQAMGAVILPFTNFSSGATINITAWSAANGTGTSLYTTGTISAVPYTLIKWDTVYTGVNAYGYGGGTCVRMYFPTIRSDVMSITITIVDSGNTQGYMEIGRIVAGTYWSPTYNTEFGLSIDYNDTSQHSRTQSGNIITDIGPVYKTITFNLSYMNAADRNVLLQILKLNGMRKSMFISIFPNDTDIEREFMYQIYGRLSSNPTITYPMYSIYAASITIQEV